ncbi:tol-pal system protein YbgF [Desulfovibrio litoralis]|uniref:Tol-pal system protein YbgF n=1 Tax=Desulfovibrio litoralis DSM 11393 TaxID=1121455 RepID=A0A1M7S7X5_9BACT|nr:tol-pal system protein YbgF [Desulfovibrio litoralis]SHN54508.1 tol-pal system protein YbgF [Desulfovibrio litoralis DSM 11393]
MKLRLLTVLALMSLSLTACVTGDNNNVNARLDEQDRKIAAISNQAREVDQILPSQAESWSQIQAMRNDIARINGQLDDINMRTSQINDAGQLRTEVANLSAAVRQMAAQLGVEVSSLNAVTPPPSDMNTGIGTPPSTFTQPITQPQTAPQTQVNSDTAKVLYDSGTQAFSERRYKDAIKIFDDFNKNFSKHQLAGNSQFWRGESFFQLGDFANAALAYQEVISKYPSNQKLQSAYLKQGMAFYRVGKKDAANLRFNELIKKYPNSHEAASAKKFMASNK